MVKNVLSIFTLFLATSSSLSHKNFVLISAPGSGKGTFSQYLIQKYGYDQICPGDIFRNEIAAQTELGKKIQPIVEKGEYVDEEIVCQLIADKLSNNLKNNQPFIIDGFPRSNISFQFLYKFFKDHNLMHNVCFLQLIANDDTCVDRILGRQICTKCFKVYNTSSAQPQEQNKCDDCNIDLIRRKADTKDIAMNRLEYFHTHVEPLMELAKKLFTVKKIETECALQKLHEIYDILPEENA